MLWPQQAPGSQEGQLSLLSDTPVAISEPKDRGLLPSALLGSISEILIYSQGLRCHKRFIPQDPSGGTTQYTGHRPPAPGLTLSPRLPLATHKAVAHDTAQSLEGVAVSVGEVELCQLGVAEQRAQGGLGAARGQPGHYRAGTGAGGRAWVGRGWLSPAAAAGSAA